MTSKSTKRRRVRLTPKKHPKAQAPRQGAKRAIASGPSTTKLTRLTAILNTPNGATLAQMMALTGWQAHSVRGAMSGALKKKRGLSIVSQKVGDQRIYRIASKK